MQLFVELFGNIGNFTWQQGLMILIGCVLIWCAIKREMEPTLLLPMGFGAILVNLPFVNTEAIETLFEAGIATELFPLLLFIGIGAMIDFGPLLSNPKMMLFGAAAQFGIFFTLGMAVLVGFNLHRHHRRGGRPHQHLCGQLLQLPIPGGYHGGGIQLYGPGAYCAAAGDPALHHQKGAQDPYAL